MIRYLLVYLWLIAVYVVTAITATNNILPVPPELLEARNIIVHATTYAITGVLLAWAGDRPGQRFDAGALLVLLITALLLGVGQEVLQSLLRGRIRLLPSLFDLFVDTSGAAVGLLLYTRVLRARAVSAMTDAAD
ncbi:MAG: VanZ family protein [Aggregatilineales bacterium]|nr:VanZ family protein [Aggregatilineales bacterium]